MNGPIDEATNPAAIDALAVLALSPTVPRTLAEALVGTQMLDDLERAGLLQSIVDEHGRVVRVADSVGAAPGTAVDHRHRVDRFAAALMGSRFPRLAPSTSIAFGRIMIDAERIDADVMEQAARAALLLRSLDDAIDFATTGLRHDPHHVGLRHLLSMAHESRGRHGAAAVTAVAAGTDDAAWLGRWASNLYLSTGRVVIPNVEDPNNELRANQCWIQAFEGDVDVVAHTVSQVLDDPRSSAQAAVWACVAGALPAALDGRPAIADKMIAHAGSIVDANPDLTPFSALQVDLIRFVVGVRLGRLDEMERHAADEIERAEPPFMSAVWNAFGGFVARERGDFPTAVVRFDVGRAFFAGSPFGLGEWADSERAVCVAMSAEPRTDSRTDSTDERSTSAPTLDGLGLFRSCLLRNEAWVRAADGRVGDAQRLLTDAVTVAADLGQNVHQALAIVDIARFGRPSFAESLLGDLTSSEADVIAVIAQATVALASSDPAALLAAHLSVRRLGFEPLASDLGIRALEASSKRHDTTAQARVELQVRVTAFRTPIAAEAERAESVVTERERVVARLAATSLTSREIAEQLAVSVRTVDNLLGRTYRKAGLSGRDDLARLLTVGR